ncbi:GGDEF domain-containing protein [Marinomonas epiphytica]
MAIRTRFLLFTALIILFTGLFSWLSMKVMAEGIVVKWMEIYAEKQLRYDKVRTLLPLVQEVKLSKEFAELESIKQWAEQPNNSFLQKKALQDAEAFRHRFSDNSYFIALRENGHYFYSDSDAREQSTDLYRYTLDPEKPEDAWFYSIMDLNMDLHLNVNPDLELGVVKLWSDVLIRRDNEVLGVVGTGLDLSTFLSRMVEKQDIYSAVVFTNYEGSIQLHQKEELINFSSVSKQLADKKTVFQIVDDRKSRQALEQSFIRAKSSDNKVEMVMVNQAGERQLASVIYLPEIDWFQVNFIEIDRFLPWTEFSGLIVVFLVSLICALIIYYLLVTLLISRPLESLDRSISSLENKQYEAAKVPFLSGLEIKRLIQHYNTMSDSFLKHQEELEKQVTERTAQLKQLASHDSLTGLVNRRGLEEHMKHSMAQWEENQRAFGLINVDVDDFKKINDQYGHSVGDQLLAGLAQHLKQIMGSAGVVARWGGDEFLILVSANDPAELEGICQRFVHCKQIYQTLISGQSIQVSYSLGSALIQQGDTQESLYTKADKAMYKAKFAHHNS